MGRVSVELDEFNLEKLIRGEPLHISTHINPVDQITIGITPNAVSNLKKLIYERSDISSEEIRKHADTMLRKNLILHPKSIEDVYVLNTILKDEE